LATVADEQEGRWDVVDGISRRRQQRRLMAFRHLDAVGEAARVPDEPWNGDI